MTQEADKAFNLSNRDGLASMNPSLIATKKNINEIQSTYGLMQNCLQSYDEKLVQVLSQHESDFIYAYKTHMYKIERELKALKQKSKEQDAKLTQDVRIISL